MPGNAGNQMQGQGQNTQQQQVGFFYLSFFQNCTFYSTHIGFISLVAMVIEKSDDDAKTATAANADARKLPTTIFATSAANENAIPTRQWKHGK